ncbi:DUF4145 domain-containing protein [Candidatus Parcubacteria bacterium]|nr:DUF4145 domain-containing protein [Candidatus Parcubacteria bacterium]
MISEKQFLTKPDHEKMTREDVSIALLWYFEKLGNEDGKKISELAKILEKEGYGRPNVTTLKGRLIKSQYSVKAKKNSFRISAKKLVELNEIYNPLLDIIEVNDDPSVLPGELSDGVDKKYILNIIKQINTSYNVNNYDCCAVMIRRLMESLIIEIYVKDKRDAEIKNGVNFFMLDRLSAQINGDSSISLSRGMKSSMDKIKELGDTASHHRTYITLKKDIDDEKLKIRKTLNELFVLSEIKK